MTDWTDEHRLLSSHVDTAYYLEANPDVAAAGADPVAHFMTQGWREGRNPNPDFQVAYYLRANGDVAAAGVNPLLHYLSAGKAEGRQPRRPLTEERTVVEAASPARLSGGWDGAPDPEPDLNQTTLVRLLDRLAPRDASLIVAFSHDDCERNIGGVQNLVRAEASAFAQLGLSYLHVSPQRPHSFHSEFPADRTTYSLRLNGKRLGATRASDLLAALRRGDGGAPLVLVVHHLLHHSPEVVAQFTELDLATTIFWVHDFLSVCPNYVLLRNDVSFCGGPPEDSGACTICAYGRDRARSRERIRRFFAAAAPQILAPSESALSVWRKAAGLPYRAAAVQPLARLNLSRTKPRETPSGPIRVAHLGAPAMLKGWPTFRGLAARFADDPRYRFYQLGHTSGRARGVEYASVSVTRETPNAMIDAITELGIDVIVNWSICSETFCFAAFESLAAGAAIVTHPNAGNVTALVRENRQHGLVVDDEGGLHALFGQGQLAPFLSAGDRFRGSLIPEGGTATWLQETMDGRAVLRRLVRTDRIEAMSGIEVAGG
ncbi:MAG TPA: hypothetical protein VGL58_04990 [Caulobacteraceae bacterium]|jgi:hypothetical protein